MLEWVINLHIKCKLKMFCLLFATDFPGLVVKGKIKVTSSSDVIKQSMTL